MEKDFYSNTFFSDNERYADIINAFGCDGEPFVKGKDLQELDTRTYLGRQWGRRQKIRWKRSLYRDLLRKSPFGVNFAIIGIENQEEIDYALPLRVMCYDAGEYERQATQIRKHTRKHRKGLLPGEYLYGFRKTSRLFPTITFVLYYGEKEWDGPKELHEILSFQDIPESLRKKISNYSVQIIDIRKLKDTDILKTDVKQVFDFIRFSKDKKKLKELMEEDENYAFLDEEAYEMVVNYVGEEEMFRFRMKNKYRKDGKVNMCQGLREWMEDERNEGREEGREEGEARVNRLIQLLAEKGRTDDIIEAASNSKYQKKLFKEFDI